MFDLDVGYWMLDVWFGCWILDVGCLIWMFDVVCLIWMLYVECWMMDVVKMLDLLLMLFLRGGQDLWRVRWLLMIVVIIALLLMSFVWKDLSLHPGALGLDIGSLTFSASCVLQRVLEVNSSLSFSYCLLISAWFNFWGRYCVVHNVQDHPVIILPLL